MAEITYAQAGVDTAEGARAVDAIRDAVKSTYRSEVIGDIGGFGGLFSAAAFKDMEDPVMVSGTDGVGTKLALANRLDMIDNVGIDLVAMCANDILACGAEPLFFLDYIAIGHIESERMARIVSGIAEGCRQAGCALIGGEMAEHPGVMADDDFDLSGFCVGIVDRPRMLDPQSVREGDVILGLESSGIHSNGYSLVRAAVTDGCSDEELAVPLDELGGATLSEALLAPTRIYVKPVLAALGSGTPIHALAHITGGGITENLNRALPAGLDALIDLDGFEMKPIIRYMVGAAGLTEQEALKTFNCGIGMMVVCDPTDADELSEIFEKAGERVARVGSIVASDEGSAAAGKVIYRGTLH